MKFVTMVPEYQSFFDFINERHAIYLRRQAGESWPWTKDWILQKYKFTNVFRELDAVTVWFRENWREPYKDNDMLFFNTCVFRYFNWPETAKIIRFTKEPREWVRVELINALRAAKERKEKIFTGAYMITGSIAYKHKEDKIWQAVYVLDEILKRYKYYKPRPDDTLQFLWKRLIEAEGFAGFLAYEVVTDMRHTPFMDKAEDINTWANAGPGAMRGIHRLLGSWNGSKNNVKRPFISYLDVMRRLLLISNTEEVLGEHVPELELRDIEHSLCEWDKYERVRLDQGTPRSKYKPPHMR